MAEPFRLRVMKALQAVIEGASITTPGEDSNSTSSPDTLADRVFRGRNWFGEDDPLPMISILEKPIAPDQVISPMEAPKSTGQWELMIQGFCQDDPQNPSDPAYFLVADVIAAIAAEKKRIATVRRGTGTAPALLGILAPNGKPAVLDIQIGAPVCRPPDEVNDRAYFWLQIAITLAENLEDPYG